MHACIIFAFIVIPGSVIGSYYGNKKNKLMKELERMAIDYPKCSKCGKEIPSGDYEFCPFCAASLKGSKKAEASVNL